VNWSLMTDAERREAIEAGVAEKLSASKIAERHGCNKNIILGHARRHGVKVMPPKKSMGDVRERRRERHLRTYVAKTNRAPRRRLQAPPLVPRRPRPIKPINPPVSLLARRMGFECSFIEGEPVPFALCCGAPVEGNTSWCGWHLKIVAPVSGAVY
jgi:hypothetical protein